MNLNEIGRGMNEWMMSDEDENSWFFEMKAILLELVTEDESHGNHLSD